MATVETFKNYFAARLRKEYGQEIVSDDRIREIWNGIKHLPDSVIDECGKHVVAKNLKFPGVDKVVEGALIYFKSLPASSNPRPKTDSKCACGGNGVRLVDGYAFQCLCPAGKMNYPNCPLYTGQAPFRETRHESATEIISETRKYENRFDKQTGKFSFFIKENPWREHNTYSGREEFGPIKAIPEKDR